MREGGLHGRGLAGTWGEQITASGTPNLYLQPEKLEVGIDFEICPAYPESCECSMSIRSKDLELFMCSSGRCSTMRAPQFQVEF